MQRVKSAQKRLNAEVKPLNEAGVGYTFTPFPKWCAFRAILCYNISCLNRKISLFEVAYIQLHENLDVPHLTIGVDNDGQIFYNWRSGN